MNLLADINWIWPALGLAFSLGGIAAFYWMRNRDNASGKVNREYFKGLNFLLNEQPDKAIEVFIKALEVDSETVELHLALGGLFRRKGQVDRATRIHQNLIARPSLTEEHRLQAIYELAQDYYKAGLLDRAENLYKELQDSVTYRAQSLEGLCRIYQQEKDWRRAIEVSKLHRRSDRAQYTKRIAHYWCEMAEQDIDARDYDSARKCLRSAQAEDRSGARAVLLRGELNYRQKNYSKALSLWQSLSVTDAKLAGLVVDKMIDSFEQLGEHKGLRAYLKSGVAIPKDSKAFAVWRKALIDLFGETASFEMVIKQVELNGLSGALADHLWQKVASGDLPVSQQNSLLKDLLSRAKIGNIEYTCEGCGFDTKALHWLCPNCGEWDSFN